VHFEWSGIMGIHTDPPPNAPHRIGGSLPSPKSQHQHDQHGTPPRTPPSRPGAHVSSCNEPAATTTTPVEDAPASAYSVPGLNKRVKLDHQNTTSSLDLVSLPSKDLLAVADHLHPRCQANLSLTCKAFSEKKYDHATARRSVSLVEYSALDREFGRV